MSYLIHSEIKALEKKLKALEKELEHHAGCEDRENQLKIELRVLQDERGEFEMNLTVKDAAYVYNYAFIMEILYTGFILPYLKL